MLACLLLSCAQKGEAGADGAAGPPGRMGDDVRKLLWFLTVTAELIDAAKAQQAAEINSKCFDFSHF